MPNRPAPRAAPPVTAEHRSRLLEGMADAIAERGYGETTIADIVRAARVSKRTFYEHFASKEECLLALYVAASELAIQVIVDARARNPELETQIGAALRAYLGHLQEHPALVRTLLVEILAAGPAGLAVRGEMNRRYAELLLIAVEADRARHPGRRDVPVELAAAVIGGINELILQAVLDGRAARLLEVAGPAEALVRAVLLAR